MTRVYDAAGSRSRLLDAAHDLFSERGYDGATTRQIAERANVDAALIARYFGNKQQLYLAAVAHEAPAPTSRLSTEDERGNTPESIAAWVFRRTRDTGPGPSMQALVRSDTALDIRAAAARRIDELLITPLADALMQRGVDQPRLRAEFVIFSLVGLIVGRAQDGSQLDLISQDDLVQLVSVAMSSIVNRPASS